MTDTNVVKQLEVLLAPIKKDLGAINKKLVTIDGRLNGIDGRLNGIDGRLNGIDIRLNEVDEKLIVIDERLDGVDVKLDQHTGSLINIEDTIKVYGDMYQVNNDNERKLEKRIDVLESNEGIIPPQEFRLIDL